MKITTKKVMEFLDYLLKKGVHFVECIFNYLMEHIGDKTDRLMKYAQGENREILIAYNEFCKNELVSK